MIDCAAAADLAVVRGRLERRRPRPRDARAPARLPRGRPLPAAHLPGLGLQGGVRRRGRGHGGGHYGALGGGQQYRRHRRKGTVRVS